MARLVLAFVLWTVCSGLALADTQADRIVAAWNGWAQSQGVKASALVVSKRGRVISEVGRGMDPGKALPIASLSKPITGACVAALARQGRLSLNAPLGQILGADAGRHAQTPLSAFATHSAGLWPDRTQRSLGLWTRGQSPQHRAVALPALARKPSKTGTFRYNNENYAVLGLVIEKVTGQSYETACRRLALNGAKMQMSRRWGPAGAFGGWLTTARNYARFVDGQTGRGGTMQAGGKPWPSAKVSGSARYGMGVQFTNFGGRSVHWHTGLLCDALRRGGGAFFGRYGGKGPTVVVVFDQCISRRAMTALDAALAKAALR